MRLAQRILCFFVVLLVGLGAPAQVPIYTKPVVGSGAPGVSTNPLKIAVLGASESARSANWDNPWPERLVDLLNQGGPRQVVVKNLAYHGATFFQANTSPFYGANTMVQEAIAFQPDVVIVEFGGNDLMNAQDGRNLATVKTDSDTTWSTLRAGLPSALIIAILERAHDNANFPTPTVTLKNKGIATMFFDLSGTAAPVTGLYTNEMLELTASATYKARTGDLEALNTYIKANGTIGSNWILQDFWKLHRLGCTLPDIGHGNLGCQQLQAAWVYKQLKLNAAFVVLFPRLSNQIIADWQDPDVFFTYYLTASGDGYVRSGTELVTNGSFAVDANWNKFFGVTIAAGVMAFDGVTSMAPSNTFLSPIVAIPITVGQTYFVTYTINGGTTLNIAPSLGGVSGTARSGAGTFTDTITAVSTAGFTFNAITSTGARTGSIDNLSITTTPADTAGLNGSGVNRWWGDQTLFSPEEWYLPSHGKVAIWPQNLTVTNTSEYPGTLRFMLRGGPPTQLVYISIAAGAFISSAESTDTHGNFDTTINVGSLGLGAGTFAVRFKCGTEAYGPYSVVVNAALAEATYAAATNTVGFTATGAQFAGARNQTLNLTGVLGGAANIQAPTAASIIAAIPGAFVGQTYRLRIINTAGVNIWTVTTNTGITLSGTMTIATNTFRDFAVSYTGAGAVTIQSVGTGTQS